MKDKNLVDLVEQAVGKNDLSPEQLHIEITESSLMEDVDRNMRVLHQIREIGCSFSIDDFGTGYSSLSYLKRLPIYAIKIDRSFVIGLPDDAQDCALVRAITAMARGLNLEVVAEGVDSEAQLKFLRDADCRIIQGYFYSKPLPLDSFVSYAQAVGAWAGPGVS
jgi:EAL domain-containing protein (putative c-di-GMP-specific phosphodiesterase class I)